MNARLSSRLPRRPDVAIALAGLVLSLVLLPLRLFASSVFLLTVPLALGGACSLYLLSVRYGESFQRPGWTVRWNGVVAAELVGIGLAAIAIAAALEGTRTVPVLLLSGAVGSLILFQIAFFDADSLDERLVLAQVLAHAFVVRATGLLTTPGFVGVDSWTHVTQYSASVAEAGSLAPMAGVKYYLAPFHHLATVVGADLLGVSLQTALYLVVGGAVLLSVLLVYAIARYFVDVRWALFATATFAMADHAIRWGMHVIPTSLGLVFFLGVVFAVTRLLHAETGRVDWAMLCGFIVAITLTHQVSAFVSLVFVGSAVVAQVLVGHVDGLSLASGHSDRTEFASDSPSSQERSGPIADGSSRAVGGIVPLHFAFAFHVVFTGGVWALTPWHDGQFLTEASDVLWSTVQTSAGFLAVSGSGSAAGAAGGGGSSTFLAELASYVNATGFVVLLFVAVVGSLALVRHHRSPQAAHTLVVGIVVMLGFTLVLPLFGIDTLLPGRWYAFLYGLMAVVGAVGMAHIGGRLPARAVGVLFVVLLLAYPFAMVTAQKATLDDPTFEDQWPRFSYTESELAAVDSIDDTMSGESTSVFTDHPYKSVFTRSSEHPGRTFNLSDTDGTDPPYRRVVYRQYQSEGAPQFVDRGGAVVTTQVDRDQVCPSTRNHVYATEQTRLCTRPDV